MNTLAILLISASLACAAAKIELNGYFCASCPSNTHPLSLIANIHPAYSTVILSFAGWDTNGTVTNSWDCNDKTCPKNFTLSASMVYGLKQEGRTVLMSVGGAAGAVLTGSEPPSFVANMVKGLVNLSRTFNLDGFDFDIENRAGDVVACSDVVSNIISGLRAALPRAIFTMAPQMPDLYPDIAEASLGFNAQAPLVSMQISNFEAIQIQMYNTWAQVETIAYAETYAPALVKGFTVTGDSTTYTVQIPATKLFLGYPASTSGASSGFIEPTQVVGLYKALASQGVTLGGLMTWCIGWDEIADWQFATAVANANNSNNTLY